MTADTKTSIKYQKDRDQISLLFQSKNFVCISPSLYTTTPQN